MTRRLMRLAAALTALCLAPAACADDHTPADGAARDRAGGFEVYDAEAGRWLEPEQYWLAWAARRGGLTWGRGADYPPYGAVKEHDTFMVETAHGPCLMAFFHQRWRRANDVWRWNDRYNDYGGCARVFD